ncbi:PQQ-binding-like beta-propeller repeat protein [Ruania albidiflava]|uniref:outer membrane protein assembly factor BamB family protein n=1 Tax=Ruania albidiflava TaxID=366586 RepID=UPI0003B46B1F|nr:PQQ-binding-like beta-propeller repeat protein [Ruania albidiflava]
MPAAEHPFPWPVPVLGLLGVAGLVVGWLHGVVPWYLGAVLVGLAGLVAAARWSRWLYPVVLVLVVALAAVPTLLVPQSDAGPQLATGDVRVSVSDEALVTLEQDRGESTLTAWSRSDGQQLWTLTEEAAEPTDSSFPLPLVLDELVIVGDLRAPNRVDGWPTLGAVDLTTGAQLWRSEVTGQVLGHHAGVLVVATPEQMMDELGPGTVRGLDARTGEVLWTEEGVLPTAGVPMVATGSDGFRWGAYVEVADLPLLALREVTDDGPERGAQLLDPTTGARLAQLPVAAAGRVMVLADQVVLVHDQADSYQVTGHDTTGQQLWRTEVDGDAPDLRGLDAHLSGAVLTAGERVLLDHAGAALDLRTGEIVDYPVRAVPASTEDILVGAHYAVTTAVTDSGYFAVLDLAAGQVQAVPPELGGSDRPDAFYGGEDGVLLYTDVLERPFGRTECRVRALAVSTMAITEHRLGECTDPAPVTFWGDVPMVRTEAGWLLLGDL